MPVYQNPTTDVPLTLAEVVDAELQRIHDALRSNVVQAEERKRLFDLRERYCLLLDRMARESKHV